MNYELVMPKKYVDLSEEEMEYDGGWWVLSAAIALGGLAITGVGILTNNDTVKAIGVAATVVGIASTGIGIVVASNAALTATTATASIAAGKTIAVEATLGVLSGTIGTASILNDNKKK